VACAAGAATLGSERDTGAVYAVIVTGAPGSGKSSTLEALSDRLHDEDVAHACIDADAVGWAHPALPATTHLRHVAALAGLYRVARYDLLLVGAAISSAPERDALVDALAADEHFLVRLDAAEGVLQRRIREREPPGWSQLRHLLDRASRMHELMAALEADLAIDTERLPPAVAALEICRACARLSAVKAIRDD
jgi:chloramphenicol 3-O-phosphotransferase